ncbi:hypothetical protein NKI72_22245 [Mesorhizobium sp. M0437]|uniref:hypothetical protein n=1 Tax=unclassified Mesorhizobium TaxID=325217 RepID=UPI00333A219D
MTIAPVANHYVAADSDTLARSDRVDRMRFLAKAQIVAVPDVEIDRAGNARYRDQVGAARSRFIQSKWMSG